MIHSRLFWRFFVATLLVVVSTALISVQVESYLRERNMHEIMDEHLQALYQQRDKIIVALEKDDFAAINAQWQENPGLAREIRISDAQGRPLPDIHGPRGMKHGNKEHMPPPPGQENSQTMGIFQNPQENSLTVTSDNGQIYQVALTPRMSWQEINRLRDSGWAIRFAILLILSTLICGGLTRMLTTRIQRLQQGVKAIAGGDYLATENLPPMGRDELGDLGRDIIAMAGQLQENRHARKQMLSDISHELRSPLARLNVALALAQAQAPQAEKSLQRIERESGRMNELIGQIIHIQRSSSMATSQERVNLVELIHGICRDAEFEFADARLDCALPESPVWVRADRARLASALENIIRNAIAHSPTHAAVEIQLNAAENPLQITIADHGSGVPEADLSRIFTAFVRLDASRNRNTGGYGLGLAIAHGVIVEELGGSLVAQNRPSPDHGLILKITLPRVISSSNEMP